MDGRVSALMGQGRRNLVKNLLNLYSNTLLIHDVLITNEVKSSEFSKKE